MELYDVDSPMPVKQAGIRDPKNGKVCPLLMSRYQQALGIPESWHWKVKKNNSREAVRYTPG
eukprot:8607964-Ditylum_brightwellii.AAC.1